MEYTEIVILPARKGGIGCSMKDSVCAFNWVRTEFKPVSVSTYSAS